MESSGNGGQGGLTQYEHAYYRWHHALENGYAGKFCYVYLTTIKKRLFLSEGQTVTPKPDRLKGDNSLGQGQDRGGKGQASTRESLRKCWLG